MVEHTNTPQVIFVEGIHGSGKSTLAKAIAEDIKLKNPSATIYLRSATPNPIDLCRLAFFSLNEYNQFLTTVSEETNRSKEQIHSELLPYVASENEKVVVNWYDFLSRFNTGVPFSMSFALSHELCDGKSGVNQYIKALLERWMNFSRNIDDSGIYIFEGALFQHPLAELMGYYMLEEDEIVTFIVKLVACINEIEKRLIYISVTDIYKILSDVAISRRSANNDWIQGFQKMISTCNYGVKNDLTGMDGAVKYCKERVRVEKRIMRELDIPINVVERS